MSDFAIWTMYVFFGSGAAELAKQTVRKHVRSRSGHFAVLPAIFTIIGVKKYTRSKMKKKKEEFQPSGEKVFRNAVAECCLKGALFVC